MCPRVLLSTVAISGLLFARCHLASAAEPVDGFSSLFPGDGLQGWVQVGPAGFSIDEGVLTCDGSGNDPTWLRSEEVFENFELRFEFRLGLYGEGGVFLHAPRHGRNSNVGFEIQLSDDTRNPGPVTISTGAIFAATPPSKQNSRPLHAWNEMGILFDWPRLRVTLNNEVVQDLNVEEHPALADRLRSGFLGFQDRGKPIEFRKLEIKRLPSKESWHTLFAGENFDGWAIVEPDGARWKIENGELLAEDGNGYLVTQSEWQDFELHTYFKSSPRANGGVFFRWKSLVPKDRGYEVQIENIADSNNPTGSIYDLVRADVLPFDPNDWTLLQIRAQGPHCRVRVNGVTVAETNQLKIVRPGHIALQMHSREHWIRFKDIKIKPLY